REANTSRRADVPAAPTAGNSCFANDAPVCTDAMATTTASKATRVRLTAGTLVRPCGHRPVIGAAEPALHDAAPPRISRGPTAPPGDTVMLARTLRLASALALALAAPLATGCADDAGGPDGDTGSGGGQAPDD